MPDRKYNYTIGDCVSLTADCELIYEQQFGQKRTTNQERFREAVFIFLRKVAYQSEN